MRLTLLELFGDGIKKGTKGSVQHIIMGNKETLRVWGDEEAVLIAILPVRSATTQELKTP